MENQILIAISGLNYLISKHVIFFSKIYTVSSFGNSVDPDLLPSIEANRSAYILFHPYIYQGIKLGHNYDEKVALIGTENSPKERP